MIMVDSFLGDQFRKIDGSGFINAVETESSQFIFDYRSDRKPMEICEMR